MRNYKLWNHWIAEVRDIAVANDCYFEGEEDSEGNPKYMTKTSVKYVFDKSLIGEYFKDGLSPQEAFELETSNWDSY